MYFSNEMMWWVESKFLEKLPHVSPGEKKPKKEGRKKGNSILLSQIKINLPQNLIKWMSFYNLPILSCTFLQGPNIILGKSRLLVFSYAIRTPSPPCLPFPLDLNPLPSPSNLKSYPLSLGKFYQALGTTNSKLIVLAECQALFWAHHIY